MTPETDVPPIKSQFSGGKAVRGVRNGTLSVGGPGAKRPGRRRPLSAMTGLPVGIKFGDMDGVAGFAHRVLDVGEREFADWNLTFGGECRRDSGEAEPFYFRKRQQADHR